MSSNSRFVVLTGWHNIVHIALPLLPPPYFASLSLTGLISTWPTSPFRAPFRAPFFFLLAFPILFVTFFVTSGVHEHRCICCGDVVPTHYGLCVQFTWSKTIQFSECVLELPLVRIPDSPSCPVRFL